MKAQTNKRVFFLILVFLATACGPKNATLSEPKTNAQGQPIYRDVPYLQEYSVRYELNDQQAHSELKAISANRDGFIEILAGRRLWVPDNGSFYFSGKFTPDVAYHPMLKKNIRAITTYHNQTVYLDDKQIFSNAWAGKIQIDHGLPGASAFAGGKDFHFLVSDGNNLVYLDQSGKKLWSGTYKGVKQISYNEGNNCFLLVTSESVAEFIPGEPVKEIYKGSGVTSAAFQSSPNRVVVGTSAGYLFLPEKQLIGKLPCTNITTIQEIDSTLWFGSTDGAFSLNGDGKYSYFAGERWLPGNQVVSIQKGPDHSVLILTNKGLGQIYFKEMTLEDKAMFFEKQVRQKNIRYGFNCSATRLINDYASGQMAAQPSDNLWTGMYLASQLFRYKVTGSQEALENARESLDAMERLYTVTGIKGLFARSFERDYTVENAMTSGWKEKELLTGSPAQLWLRAADHPNWTWRSTASSDQTIGQVFGLTAVLELSDDTIMKQKALTMLDNLMSYIVDNNLYIIDVDGEPTLWGKWNPEYVNHFPKNVGDRKICSSNMIAMLQTAYHFTKKEKFKEKAFELMTKFGYFENLMRPMEEIGKAGEGADIWSKNLSEEWNHSDDEMYFLAYWGLYPYAFNDTLKADFAKTIEDHWNIERPEHNALWNFTYAMTGAKPFDLDQSIGFLKNYPMDMRNWAVQNSQRKDIDCLPPNFRGQTTKELLPLGELPLYRHNGQIFTLDSNGDGKTLISAGDVWLLPYWMGRYLGVISAPEKTETKNINIQ
jgi:hypothetical protein